MLPYVGEDPLRVDIPGGTRYVRVASGVNPPILIKQRFGEFAATPQSDPAYLTIDPAWVERNIVTTDVPLLGTITCHRKLIPMVRGALYEIVAAGLVVGDQGVLRLLGRPHGRAEPDGAALVSRVRRRDRHQRAAESLRRRSRR